MRVLQGALSIVGLVVIDGEAENRHTVAQPEYLGCDRQGVDSRRSVGMPVVMQVVEAERI